LEKSWGEDGTGFHRFSVLGSAEGERWQAEPRCSPPHDLFSSLLISEKQLTPKSDAGSSRRMATWFRSRREYPSKYQTTGTLRK
jgi:hypothetical protein